jgi:hypothetical protein
MRLVEAGAVISEVLRRPGPTHSVFDVLAAAVWLLAPGPRVVMLGFAAGGMVAPLRALGHRGPIVGVDRSRRGWAVFRRLCSRWAGAIDLQRADAAAWLRGRRGRFDAVVEDLSIAGPSGVTKPAASIAELPRLVASRLDARGVAIVNLLPVPGLRWGELEAAVSCGYRHARVVRLARFENRVLIASARPLPAARTLSLGLGRALRSLGSSPGRGLSVRTVRTPARGRAAGSSATPTRPRRALARTVQERP